MALPAIVMPTALGCWLLDSYAAAPQSVYASIPMSTGADRLRRVFTIAPREEQVSLLLSVAQADLFDRWYEDGLRAGALAFSARVASLDGGTEWWAAQFIAPPQFEALHLGRWRLTARLQLSGSASATPPATAALSLRAEAHLLGRATPYQSHPLLLDISGQLDARVIN